MCKAGHVDINKFWEQLSPFLQLHVLASGSLIPKAELRAAKPSASASRWCAARSISGPPFGSMSGAPRRTAVTPTTSARNATAAADRPAAANGEIPLREAWLTSAPAQASRRIMCTDPCAQAHLPPQSQCTHDIREQWYGCSNNCVAPCPLFSGRETHQNAERPSWSGTLMIWSTLSRPRCGWTSASTTCTGTITPNRQVECGRNIFEKITLLSNSGYWNDVKVASPWRLSNEFVRL